MNPPPWLILPSDLYYRLYPIAVGGAIAALGVSILFRQHRRLVVVVSIGALMLLLEPTAFLCYMLVPLIMCFDPESEAAFFMFVLEAVLPASLPIPALWLTLKKRKGIF
jgi:hypothetical protein